MEKALIGGDFEGSRSDALNVGELFFILNSEENQLFIYCNNCFYLLIISNAVSMM